MVDAEHEEDDLAHIPWFKLQPLGFIGLGFRV